MRRTLLSLGLLGTLCSPVWAQAVDMAPPEPQPTPTPRTPNPVTPPEREAVWLFQEGQRLHRSGEPARALDLYRRALVQDPGRLEYRPYLGLALDAVGQSREALEQYDLYLKLEPADTRVKLLQAAAYLHAGEVAQARAATDALLLQAAGNAYLHNLRGLILLREGKPAEAVPEFQAALGANPGMLEARINLSAAYLQAGQLDLAKTELQGILAQKPTEARALNNLGVLEARDRDLKGAQTSLEQSKDLAEASLNLANVLYRMQLDREALLVLAKLLDDSPKMPEAHLLNARVLTRQNRLEEARKEIDLVLADGPSSPLWSYANEVSGLVYLAEGRDDAARVDLEKAVKADGSRASAHHNYSMALGRTNNLTLAIAEEKQAIALGGEQPPMLYHLAVLYDLDARPADAVPVYQKYLAVGKLNAEEQAGLKEHIEDLQQRISGKPGKPARP